MPGDSRVGTEIAGHRVEAVIGRGGMSVVYLAEHLRLGRRVALKILGPELAEDEAFRDRFVRESRIAAGLDHPNIVTVYDAGEADGVLYISMRYVEGTDLERLLRTENRLDPARAISIVSQCAAALDAAHAEGLVHRDVKPGNILLTRDRRTSADHAYLADFGVTKRMHTGAGLTRTGQFVGTVDYVSPEQIRNDEVDGRADVYSLGCVLYRCITGDVPFPRDTEVATIYAHLQDPPPSPSERWPALPAAIDAPIIRALAKPRDERFETARLFADAAATAIAPAVSSPAAVVPATRPPIDVTPSRASRRRIERRRRRRATLAGLGIAVAAGLVIVVLIVGSRPDENGRLTPEQPAALPRLTWEQVADPQHVFDGPNGQLIVQVLPVGSGVLAFGFNDELGNRFAAVWTSPDGRRWDRVPGESFGRSGDHRIENVTDFGERLVAVGSERAGGATDPAVWMSADTGATWSRVDSVTSGLHHVGSQAAMQAVVEHAPGLVAVGFQEAQGGFDAAIWTSTDATDWKWVTLPSFVEPGDQRMLGATNFGDQLVVVGTAASSAGDRDAAVWVESGGRWSRVRSDSLGGPGDQQIGSVVAGGPGLIAVGSDTSSGRSEAAVWTSTDGRSWSQAPASDIGPAGEGSQGMSAVSRVGAWFVAGGWSDGSGGDADGAIWLSADGRNWTNSASAEAFGGPGRQLVDALTPFGPEGLLAGGSTRVAHDQQAAIWIATVVFPSPSPTASASAS
jgi:predicted Ser/Thr protein kinase